MSVVEVEQSGICTVQDRGRAGYQALGVAVSGAWDRDAYALLGLLLGTAPAAFELLGGGLRVRVGRRAALAVVGSGGLVVGGHRAPLDTVVEAPAGATVEVTCGDGGPAYLAIGGMQVPTVLGSASRDTMGGLGPAPVRAGDRFALEPDDAALASVGAFVRGQGPALRSDALAITVIDEALAAYITAQEWTVELAARSGVRLVAPGGLPRPPVAPTVSGPVLPGMVQVPPSGEAIILGPDCGTTGGYPLAGAVVSAHLATTARLRPGGRLRLRVVSIDEAQRMSARPTPVVHAPGWSG